MQSRYQLNGRLSSLRYPFSGDCVPQVKLHNEELNDLYCSPNIVRVIK